jgi:hypothetical protein
MDRQYQSHQGERPLHGHQHASSNPPYPPPFHMPTAQPPTQIPFADPFSRGRDPFLPGPHGRKGSLGPGPQGWPPAQGTFKSMLHKSEISDAPEGPGSHHALRALLLCSCCERNFAVTCSHGTRRRLGSGTWSGQAVMRHDGGGAPRSGGEGERQHGEEAPQLPSHICRRRHPPATRCTLSDRIRLRVRHRLVPTAGARP